uniref:Uncharacterized protein n=1 Tax=Leersia perrieri TaxID=77586 RepID=A0A0D9WN99_9ORYZ
MVYPSCAEEDRCEPTVPCDNITCPELCQKLGINNAHAYCKPGDVPSCCCRNQQSNDRNGDVRRLLLSK